MDRDRFAAVAGAWDKLTRGSVSPFGDHTWFTAWWEAFGSDGALRICLLWRGEELCAALPLWWRRGRLTSLANYHTPLFSAPATDDSALEAVVDAAFDANPEELMLHAIRSTPRDPLRDAVARSSARCRRLLLVEGVHRSPLVEINGDFKGYLHARRSRSATARKWRKVNRECAGQFRFESSVVDLEAKLSIVFEVEASGWKRRDGTAILCSPQTTAFYTSLAYAYHARGDLRLALLQIDDALAAFSLCLLRGRRLYLVKTGFDERFQQFSPGLLVNLCTVERCFELGLEVYDLLGEDDQWKASFANAASDHVRLRSYRRRPVPLARYAARRLGRPIAQRLRSGLQR